MFANPVFFMADYRLLKQVSAVLIVRERGDYESPNKSIVFNQTETAGRLVGIGIHLEKNQSCWLRKILFCQNQFQKLVFPFMKKKN